MKKSLFSDSLKEAFLGNKNLFNGLYLEKNWNWNKKYPVLKVDFGSVVLKDPKKLEQVIFEILDESCKESIELKNESISGKFRELITKLEKKYLSGISSKHEIDLVEVEFSKEQKNISNFEWEKI